MLSRCNKASVRKAWNIKHKSNESWTVKNLQSKQNKKSNYEYKILKQSWILVDLEPSCRKSRSKKISASSWEHQRFRHHVREAIIWNSLFQDKITARYGVFKRLYYRSMCFVLTEASLLITSAVAAELLLKTFVESNLIWDFGQFSLCTISQKMFRI